MGSRSGTNRMPRIACSPMFHRCGGGAACVV